MFENDGRLTDELDKDPSEWILSFTILETPADIYVSSNWNKYKWNLLSI